MFDDSAQNLQNLAGNFANELTSAEKGDKTSLAFLRYFLPKNNHFDLSQSFQVVSVGGTNLESTLVSVYEDAPVLGEIQKIKLRQMKTKEDFLDQIIPIIDCSSPFLILNFAYPMAPVNDTDLLDGTLMRTTKEHSFEGLIGQKIGITVSQTLAEKCNHKIPVWCVNDVVSLLMSQMSTAEKKESSSVVGAVVGTGVNMGMFLNETEIINLESGNFSSIELSESGNFIDHLSNNQGQQLFEKEVSGGYLYQHFNYWADLLGLSVRAHDSSDVNKMAEESDAIGSLAREIVKHSARLFAAKVVGLWKYKGEPPLQIVTEGSIYWKGWQYSELVHQALIDLGINPDQLIFTKVEHSNLLGAATIPLYTKSKA